MRVTPHLNPIDLIIISNEIDGQADPAVIFNGENYQVIYNDAASAGIIAKRVSPQGVVLDTGNYLGPGSGSNDLAYDGNRCFAVWCNNFNGVEGRFINNLGQPEDTIITINQLQASDTYLGVEFGNTHYLVVWHDFCPGGTDLDIFGQLVSTTGKLIGPRITIAEGPPSQSHPGLCFDGNNFLVVWSEDSKIYGQFVSDAGQLIGNPIMVSDTSSSGRDTPVVASGLDNYLVVWSEYHTDFDIYGNLDIIIGINEYNNKIRTPVMTLQNPARINLKNIQMYDILGRRVKNYHLNPGCYFIKKERGRVEKIIIIR